MKSFRFFSSHVGPREVLQSLLGHTSTETTLLYTHALEDKKRQAVEGLARLLFPNVPSEDKLLAKGSTLIQ